MPGASAAVSPIGEASESFAVEGPSLQSVAEGEEEGVGLLGRGERDSTRGRHLSLMGTDILIPHPCSTQVALICGRQARSSCPCCLRQVLWVHASLSARSLVMLLSLAALLLVADCLALRTHHPTASGDELLHQAALLPALLLSLSHVYRLRTGVLTTTVLLLGGVFLLTTAASGILGGASPTTAVSVLLQLVSLGALAVYNTYYSELNARRALLLVMASRRAKRQADSVMGQLLPASVNDALSRNEAIPFTNLPHDAVILWADLVGFTALSSTLDSMAVLRLLHGVFAKCDALVEAAGLWKLDTIGDAYVCVGFSAGPNDGPELVEKQFALALQMQSIVTAAAAGVGAQLGVRVGIHAGPVATGIIGTLRPRFYVFGRTVLEAEHMEATGRQGRVQVSPAAAALYSRRTYGLAARQDPPPFLFERDPATATDEGDVATLWLRPQGTVQHARAGDSP